jgi:hypothetical protein
VLASGDNVNVTDLTLFRCDSQSAASKNGYILVKTPKTLVLVDMPRKELLDGIGKAMNNPDLVARIFSKKMYDDSEKTVGQALGRDVDLAGDIRPIGTDDMCAYIGGTVKVNVASKSYETAVGGCITSVGNRGLTFLFYGPDGTSEGIAALLRKAKQFAETVEVVPGS